MHPISLRLFEAYQELYDKGQVSFLLQDVHKKALDSVVKTVNATYFGFDRFPTPEDKAAAYLCFLIKDHPLTDGNKRLALLWFEAFCLSMDLKPHTPRSGWDAFVVTIEQNKEPMELLMKEVKNGLFFSR